MVWLFLSAVGIVLAFFVGIEAKVLSKKHKDRTLLTAVRITSVILVAWIITATVMIFYQSKWYLLSIAVAAVAFYACFSGNPVENEEHNLGPEKQKLNDRLEYLAEEYDKIVDAKKPEVGNYMSLNSLPSSKNEMAEALQFVYYFRLMQLNPDFSQEELFWRYSHLAHFIEASDADFMNHHEKLFTPKTPEERAKAVEFVRSDPDGFEEHRARVQNIYSAVNAEQDALWEAWEKARES